jgi:hemerythrin superfamily protein
MPDTTSLDLMDQLLRDHRQIATMFTEFDQVPPAQTTELFWELTAGLVRHEVAEEEIVYPQVRRSVPNGNRLAAARIKEQARAEELLVKMEKFGVGDDRFPALLTKLRDATLAHAEKEERLIFEPLGRVLDAAERELLGARYHSAKTAAPTHPHPFVP